MPGTVTHANWTVTFLVPWTDQQGLVISKAQFNDGTATRTVLYRAGQPFVLVPYHGGSPTFKDGLGATCGGVGLTPLIPTAPNVPGWNLPPGNLAGNDSEFSGSNPTGAVKVERLGRDELDPDRLVIWAKFQVGNYQYVHQWEFRADGSVHVRVGLGGRLFTFVQARMGHIHNFYFRLDFDVDGSANDLVQRFDHLSNNLGADQWASITTEGAQSVDPARFTSWRVVDKAPKPNGALRSWEIIPGSDGAPDGTFSTGDIWVVRYHSGTEDGVDIGCTDTRLNTVYANGEPTDGQDVVVWHVLRHHHNPRSIGEETDVVPYEFLEFHIEARDVLDATPRKIYATNPASPL